MISNLSRHQIMQSSNFTLQPYWFKQARDNLVIFAAITHLQSSSIEHYRISWQQCSKTGNKIILKPYCTGNWLSIDFPVRFKVQYTSLVVDDSQKSGNVCHSVAYTCLCTAYLYIQVYMQVYLYWAAISYYGPECMQTSV